MRYFFLAVLLLFHINIPAQKVSKDSLKVHILSSVRTGNIFDLELSFSQGGKIDWFKDDDYLLIKAIRALRDTSPDKRESHRKMIDILIKHGADINYTYFTTDYKDGLYFRTDQLNDILTELLICNDTIVLKKLASMGIKSMVFTTYNSCWVDLLAEYRILLQYYPDDTLLRNELVINSLRSKNIDAIKLLVKNGTNFNKQINGSTSLERVIESKDSVFFKKIMSVTYLSKMSDRKTTPLAYAYRNYASQSMIYLIRNGADVHEIFPDGYDVLFHAIRFQDLELLNVAIAFGADINRKNKAGNTPLYEAKLKISRQKTSKEIVAAIEKAGGNEL